MPILTDAQAQLTSEVKPAIAELKAIVEKYFGTDFMYFTLNVNPTQDRVSLTTFRAVGTPPYHSPESMTPAIFLVSELPPVPQP